MPVTIKRNNDPFKKYWWVALLGLGAIGGWVCLPLLGGGTGESVTVTEGGLESTQQSLDSINNPSGAPGGAIDLSMDGSGPKRKAEGGGMTSSLYQAPEEAPAPAAAAGAVSAPGAAFADALKKVAEKKSASVDASGWGGAKAQKGFNAPKVNLGAMSGLGGGSSSGGSASASSGGSSGGGKVSAFGSAGPKTGESFAKGLGDAPPDDPKLAGGKSASLNALQGASNASVSAAKQMSFDASRAMSGTSFDGGQGRAGAGGGGGAAVGGGSGVFGNLDAAPKNLKVNDAKLNESKITPPPPKVVPPEKDMLEDLRNKVMEMLIMGLVGGVVKMIMPF